MIRLGKISVYQNLAFPAQMERIDLSEFIYSPGLKKFKNSNLHLLFVVARGGVLREALVGFSTRIEPAHHSG
jgi:hypothetical protein